MTTPDEMGRDLGELISTALVETKGDLGAALELAHRRLSMRVLEPLAVEEAERILREGE